MDFSYTSFREIKLSDEFFDSLRADYKGFDNWFNKKASEDESAYLMREESGAILGFLYLKIENEALNDVDPAVPNIKRVKVGTLKINAHGTKLGQRFIKKIVDWSISHSVFEIYVTVFDKHDHLISLLEKYGFVKWGSKTSVSGIESVFVKKIGNYTGGVYRDYPVINASRRAFMLSIYPAFHTKLFPDSILRNENPDIIEDVSHSNSIHKIYLCNMKGIELLQPGDVLVIYRTKDNGPAEYTAVATTVGIVEELRLIDSFATESDFLAYALPYSVFTEAELRNFWRNRRYPKIVRFTYNISFKKRPNRKTLIDDVGIDRNAYPGFMELSKRQLLKIMELGNVDKSVVIDQA
ncbi:GNAT family N-acetyltransferase [Allorhizobium taibaishanense]|uniref:Acetyltransferase n=1 Tax=Allorhizobium taibaishanense TaxID=887144 RepID=A0A1Q9AAZ6_9HYPH|nr:GNAT family N-acetyltransferase [Allorhizobium taibaishanense]MBB4010364.1 L-amino acid N-acyltransferase YncA [Allorhizobium taibaishanense]OLP52048.1 acetyltransferase [Allorhizobium taibaishanense]